MDTGNSNSGVELNGRSALSPEADVFVPNTFKPGPHLNGTIHKPRRIPGYMYSCYPFVDNENTTNGVTNSNHFPSSDAISPGNKSTQKQFQPKSTQAPLQQQILQQHTILQQQQQQLLQTANFMPQLISQPHQRPWFNPVNNSPRNGYIVPAYPPTNMPPPPLWNTFNRPLQNLKSIRPPQPAFMGTMSQHIRMPLPNNNTGLLSTAALSMGKPHLPNGINKGIMNSQSTILHNTPCQTGFMADLANTTLQEHSSPLYHPNTNCFTADLANTTLQQQSSPLYRPHTHTNSSPSTTVNHLCDKINGNRLENCETTTNLTAGCANRVQNYDDKKSSHTNNPLYNSKSNNNTSGNSTNSHVQKLSGNVSDMNNIKNPSANRKTVANYCLNNPNYQSYNTKVNNEHSNDDYMSNCNTNNCNLTNSTINNANFIPISKSLNNCDSHNNMMVNSQNNCTNTVTSSNQLCDNTESLSVPDDVNQLTLTDTVNRLTIKDDINREFTDSMHRLSIHQDSTILPSNKTSRGTDSLITEIDQNAEKTVTKSENMTNLVAVTDLKPMDVLKCLPTVKNCVRFDDSLTNSAIETMVLRTRNLSGNSTKNSQTTKDSNCNNVDASVVKTEKVKNSSDSGHIGCDAIQNSSDKNVDVSKDSKGVEIRDNNSTNSTENLTKNTRNRKGKKKIEPTAKHKTDLHNKNPSAVENNPSSAAKPHEVQSFNLQSDFPELSGNSRGQSQASRISSYSDALKGAFRKSQPEEEALPLDVNTEAKFSRKWMKRREKANRAAVHELAEISLEQQMLMEIKNKNQPPNEPQRHEPIKTHVTNESPLSQPIKSAVTTTQSMKTPVTNTQPMKTPVTNTQPMKTPVTNTQPMKMSVTNSQPMKTSVTNSQPMKTSVTNPQPMKTSVTNKTQNVQSSVSIPRPFVTSNQPIQTSVTNSEPIKTSVSTLVSGDSIKGWPALGAASKPIRRTVTTASSSSVSQPMVWAVPSPQQSSQPMAWGLTTTRQSHQPMAWCVTSSQTSQPINTQLQNSYPPLNQSNRWNLPHTPHQPQPINNSVTFSQPMKTHNTDKPSEINESETRGVIPMKVVKKPQVKKSQEPITFDIAGMLDAVAHKKSDPKVEVVQQVIKTEKPAVTHNPLDSAPSQKRGKERESPKPKKPSPLKKVILKEREEKKRLRDEIEVPPAVPKATVWVILKEREEKKRLRDEIEVPPSDESVPKAAVGVILKEREEKKRLRDEIEVPPTDEAVPKAAVGVILKEREEKKRLRDEIEVPPTDEALPKAAIGVILKEREEKKRLRDEIEVPPTDESVPKAAVGVGVIAESDLSQDATQSLPTTTDLSPISQTSPLTFSPLSSGVNSPIGSTYTRGMNMMSMKIHSRRFREYCKQILDKDIDATCTSLLQDLVRFQDRSFNKDPIKAKTKRRIVLGLREVTKHLKLRKLRCVIISPNLEKIQSKGGLDDALNKIIDLCADQDVLCVFALGRRALGWACGKMVPVSVVGVFNYGGSEENFNKLVALTSTAQSAYTEIQALMERETVEAPHHRTNPAFSHMPGHSRTPSACSAVSFTSSILSEPISENYPHSEPETDSRGNEIIKPDVQPENNPEKSDHLSENFGEKSGAYCDDTVTFDDNCTQGVLEFGAIRTDITKNDSGITIGKLPNSDSVASYNDDHSYAKNDRFDSTVNYQNNENNNVLCKNNDLTNIHGGTDNKSNLTPNKNVKNSSNIKSNSMKKHKSKNVCFEDMQMHKNTTQNGYDKLDKYNDIDDGNIADTEDLDDNEVTIVKNSYDFKDQKPEKSPNKERIDTWVAQSVENQCEEILDGPEDNRDDGASDGIAPSSDDES